MTREEARKAAEVMLAYANGEEIEIAYSNSSYQTVTSPEFDWGKVEYRVKTKPTYRPFKDNEECWNEMLKHQPLGWIKNECGNIFNIIAIFKDSINLNECNAYYSELCKQFKFIDGTPFGIKEE